MRTAHRGAEFRRVGALLGAFALAVQFYLPIHYASDLSSALAELIGVHDGAAAYARDADGHGDRHPGKQRSDHSHHGHQSCLICVGSVGLIAYLPSGAADLPLPAVTALKISLSLEVEGRAAAPAAFYAPRAPPVVA